MSFEAWENQLFDEYNGERKSLLQIEADLYDDLYNPVEEREDEE